MILGPLQPQKTAGAGGRITLDDLFRAAVAQRPDHLALVDPPLREAFATGAPRRLTYAQADRAVAPLSARLDGSRDEVALQMPNTIRPCWRCSGYCGRAYRLADAAAVAARRLHRCRCRRGPR